MGLLILGLLLFFLLVVLHEFGHFIAARRNGVEVEEFGVGFPPALFTKRFTNHKTKYTINLLPLGGFVRLKGEHDSDTATGSYGSARLLSKIKIMLAGVGMNFALAWLMLLVLCLVGIPQLPLPGGEQQFKIASDSYEKSNRVLITYVEPGSPADNAGLEVQDQIIRIDNNSIATEDDLKNATRELNGRTVAIEYKRNNSSSLVKANLLSEEQVKNSDDSSGSRGYLGVYPYEYRLLRSTWSAPIVATGLTYQYAKLTMQGLGSIIKDLITGNATSASQNISGPIGIFFVIKDGSGLGYQYVLLIVALLSLTLAIMNILPIPALDGGRLFVTILYRSLKKPLTKRAEELIHGTGFAALMALFVLITVVDVRRFF